MGKRIIIGGGGTGGHVFPAISVANAVKKIQPSVEILFVGSIKGIEMEKVPEAGYRIEGLPVTGFRRKFTIKNIGFFINLIRSMRMAKRIIKRFKPDVAVGVGGYASGPILRAAAKAGIPVIIQEQNSYAGITNRLLAKYAELICTAYEEMDKYFPSHKILITGNPVRNDIINCRYKKDEGLIHFGLEKGKQVILIIGGSLGARTINEATLLALPELPLNVQVIWQTGRNYFEDVRKRKDLSDNILVKVFPFIREMDMAYGCADIIVSRAGAGTISELAVAGKPVILIPSPNVAEDHQTKNAMALSKRNAAILLRDSEAKEKLAGVITELIRNEELRNTLAFNILNYAIPDAADRIAREILNITGR